MRYAIYCLAFMTIVVAGWRASQMRTVDGIKRVPQPELRALLRELAEAEPAIAPPLRPAVPAWPALPYSPLLAIECDGVWHYLRMMNFGNWEEQMRESKINHLRLRFSEPSRHLDYRRDDLELWRLASWETMRHLDVRDYGEYRFENMRKQLMPDGHTRSTSAAETSEFTSVRDLNLGRHQISHFGSFPKLERVQVFDPEFLKEITDTYPHVLVAVVPDNTSGWSRTTDGFLQTDGNPSARSLPPNPTAEELELVDWPELEQLNELQHMPQLRKLTILSCPVGLQHIPLDSLRELTTLRLGWCGPLDDLRQLVRLPKLKSLHLSAVPIDKLSDLAQLEQLEELRLDHLDTLSELSAFHQMHSLRKFVLTSCHNVSLPEIRSLQAALPACAVHFEMR